MIAVQVPELRYDMGPRVPLVVKGPGDLTPMRFPRATFVSVAGVPDFEMAFVYRRYGLSYTYFNLQPYGLSLVVRTYEKVTHDWRPLRRFLGKLRPFERQPFHYRIRQIYREKFGTELPADAFFLSLGDVPRISGWQLGAVGFAAVLWAVLFILFFLAPRRRRPPRAPVSSK